MRCAGLAMVLAGFWLVGSGCAGERSGIVKPGEPVVSTDEYEYLDGILRRNYRAPIREVWDATLQAVADLRVTAETRRRDENKGLIQGTTHDGDRLTIEVIRKSGGLTKVEVQVGWIGDRLRSEFVHDAIADKLGHARKARGGRHSRSSA